MKRLIVYLNGEPVGILAQDDSGLLGFRYGPEWLNRQDAAPLSRSLPLQRDPFRGRHARPFFAGILPDEGPRQQIAAILGISERNDFALLERIGGECAGAVSLLPEGVPPPASGDKRRRELSEKELDDIITELPRRPLHTEYAHHQAGARAIPRTGGQRDPLHDAGESGRLERSSSGHPFGWQQTLHRRAAI